MLPSRLFWYNEKMTRHYHTNVFSPKNVGGTEIPGLTVAAMVAKILVSPRHVIKEKEMSNEHFFSFHRCLLAEMPCSRLASQLARPSFHHPRSKNHQKTTGPQRKLFSAKKGIGAELSTCFILANRSTLHKIQHFKFVRIKL